MTSPSRQQRMLAGIAALGDATRALRAAGAARRGDASESERSALFDLASLADRLSGYADDQREDDWQDLWLTRRDVDVLRARIAELHDVPRGMSPGTLPALHSLADDLASLAQPID